MVFKCTVQNIIQAFFLFCSLAGRRIMPKGTIQILHRLTSCSSQYLTYNIHRSKHGGGDLLFYLMPCKKQNNCLCITLCEGCLNQLFVSRTSFVEDHFFHGPRGLGGGDGFTHNLDPICAQMKLHSLLTTCTAQFLTGHGFVPLLGLGTRDPSLNRCEEIV